MNEIRKQTPLVRTGRIFIIGDVHGCLNELRNLVAALVPKANDRFVWVGDLVDRGPNSRGVIRHVQLLCTLYPDSISIAGNHEEKALRLHEKFLKTGEWSAKAESWMKDASQEEWDYLDSLPLILRIPEHNIIVVHGGFFPRFFDLYGEIGEPKQRWRRGGGKRMNRMRRFLRVRCVNEKGDMVALSETDLSIHPHWSSVYDGREGFAVFGHDPQKNGAPMQATHAVGIDTGCVFGAKLTALVISPQGERSFVSVSAAKAYAEWMNFDDE